MTHLQDKFADTVDLVMDARRELIYQIRDTFASKVDANSDENRLMLAILKAANGMREAFELIDNDHLFNPAQQLLFAASLASFLETESQLFANSLVSPLIAKNDSANLAHCLEVLNTFQDFRRAIGQLPE